MIFYELDESKGFGEDTGIAGNKPAWPVVGTVRVNSMGPMQWCSRSPVLAAATSGLMPTHAG